MKINFASLWSRLQFVAHLVTAGVIILEGVARAEHIQRDWPIAALFSTCGVLVAIITIKHKSFERRFRHTHSLLYCLEALVSVVIASLYIKEGKTAVQYPFLMASYMFAGLAGYSIGRPSAPHDATIE